MAIVKCESSSVSVPDFATTPAQVTKPMMSNARPQIMPLAEEKVERKPHDRVLNRSWSAPLEDTAFIDEIFCSLDKDDDIPMRSVTSTIPVTPATKKISFANPQGLSPKNGTKVPAPKSFFVNRHGRLVKGRPCRVAFCRRRSQSMGLCKSHGGGARCKVEGCKRSSQGGGLCRTHGGGKRCSVEGCEKGTQRHGLCYLHGIAASKSPTNGGVTPRSVSAPEMSDISEVSELLA